MIRRTLAVGFGMIAVLLIGAAGAWACTASPTMTLIPANPAAAGTAPGGANSFVGSAPGSTVTVKMTQGSWASTQAVQIHWNSLTGPVLATTAGGDFSVPVQVPQVGPGVYYMVAADTTNNAVQTKVAQAIEVTGPAGAAVARSTTPLPQSASHAGSGNVALGVGLLGGGMVALFSGVTVITLKRRRSSATARR